VTAEWVERSKKRRILGFASLNPIVLHESNGRSLAVIETDIGSTADRHACADEPSNAFRVACALAAIAFVQINSSLDQGGASTPRDAHCCRPRRQQPQPKMIQNQLELALNCSCTS
jgi:hypothetical protein